jgi:starch phosphorylase
MSSRAGTASYVPSPTGVETPTASGMYTPNTVRMMAEDESFLKEVARLGAVSVSGDTTRALPRPQSFDRDLGKAMYDPTGGKSYQANDAGSIGKSIAGHVEYTLARTPYNMDMGALYRATAHSVRDRLIEHWNDTQQHWADKDPKRVYYMSLEFLIGRCLTSHLINLNLHPAFAAATKQFGARLEEICDQEKDPALGNGGLGRLAACFLDSMASIDLPAWGYGIRYQYGMFEQRINQDGSQSEVPDFWLTQGNPWEIERLDVTYPVRFYGHVESDAVGDKVWTGGELVQAVAYDMPIPGFDTHNVANLRLWAARPSREFDLEKFNAGHYVDAIHARARAEQISSVLYPNDNHEEGEELRLKQQYFFVCATMADILRRFRKQPRKWSTLPDKVAIQLNDTHPILSIVELMRILVDAEKMPWDDAWEICKGTFAYTNHTVLPEALETWSVGLLTHLLPRHMEIIYQINHFWMEEIEAATGGDAGKMSRMSIIQEEGGKKVRMANLGIIGSHAINGVAAVHSGLIKVQTFPDFAEYFPEKFQNKTNGVTPRRWMLNCNPSMARVITSFLGSGDWVKNLDNLKGLRKFAKDPQLMQEWIQIKQANKERLVRYIKESQGIEIDSKSLFDIQIKRIHEYKRQFMNVLWCCHRYLSLKKMTPAERAKVVPRTVIFAGKAAPGYHIAKRIIHFINQVSKKVNADEDTSPYFKLVFLPNYNVSLAEILIPASELSQHISTAGKEASGTSNMKFAMNGCLIIGTLDGANIEIRQEIGKEHIFIFGKEVDEVQQCRDDLRSGATPTPASLVAVKDSIRKGTFGGGFNAFSDITSLLEPQNDYYIIAGDWDSYCEAQAAVDAKYPDRKAWTTSSIMSTAGTGFFSTDRTMHEYAADIWGVKPCARPKPSTS